jgi:hypothetical protein
LGIVIRRHRLLVLVSRQTADVAGVVVTNENLKKVSYNFFVDGTGRGRELSFAGGCLACGRPLASVRLACAGVEG